MRRAVWVWVRVGALLAPPLGFLMACGDHWTDSATRAAYDLEKAADAMRRSGLATYTLAHRPNASPEGCAHDYTFQLSRQSSLLVWCKSNAGDANVASHATTYHLRYVDVPKQIVLQKRAGEPVTIELKRTSGKPAVVRAY